MPYAWRDVGYAARVLLQTPGVTAFAVVSLALGIGANTAVFSVMNALVLRPLAVQAPSELVTVSVVNPEQPDWDDRLLFEMFDRLRSMQTVFSSVLGWRGDYPIVNIEANGASYVSTLGDVTGDYFATLGVAPLLGRTLIPDDVPLVAGAPATAAVLDYRCWKMRYNSDRAVLGKTIRADGRSFTIVGVMPESFTGLELEVAPEITIPLTGRKGHVAMVGRLRPGATLEQARAQFEALWAATPRTPEYERARIHVQSAAKGVSFMRERQSRFLAVLMALVAVILLIACVNLANLMLARAAMRKAEIATRVALGAGRGRLISLLLSESLLLSAAGAVAGVLFAIWAGRLLFNLSWIGVTPATLSISLDFRVLAFAAATTLVTGVLFGLAPAKSLLSLAPADALRRNARTAYGGGGKFARILLVAQVSLSLVLVVGALLLVRTLANLRSADLGFRREGLLMLRAFPLAGRDNASEPSSYFREVAEKLTSLPGVEAVSFSHMGPVSRGDVRQTVRRPGSTTKTDAVLDFAGPGFFRMIGMRLLAGREFGWRDAERSPKVAIISESLARRLFGGHNSVGERLDAGSDPEFKNVTIVGVVNSASLWSVRSHEPPAVYLAAMQKVDKSQDWIDIRVSGEPGRLAESARRALASMGRQYALTTETLEHHTNVILAEERRLALLSTFLGALAVLLAAVGIYGVTSFAVARRTAEIGVRMALGAGRGEIARMVLGDTGRLLLAGIAVGVPASLAASRLLSGILFGVSPGNPAILLTAAAFLAGVMFAAACLPACAACIPNRSDVGAALRIVKGRRRHSAGGALCGSFRAT